MTARSLAVPARLAANAVASAILAAFALVRPVEGQSLRAYGAGYQVERRLSYQGATTTQSGTWVGGGGSLAIGPVALAGGGLIGKLSASGSSGDADVQTTWARVGWRAGSSVTVSAHVEARRLKLAAGEQVRRVIGGALAFTPSLGIPGLTAVADVGYFPSAEVTGGPKIGSAIQTAFGFAFAPPSMPLFLQVTYRFERYDIQASAANEPRFEEYGGLYAGLGLRIGH